MFDPIYDADETAFELEDGINEPDELDGLMLSERDADGVAVYRFN